MTESKPIFEVGKTYKTRGGEEVKVLLRLQHDNFSKCPLLVLSVDHSDFWTATEEGRMYEGSTSERDLLPPEKPTTPFEVGKVYKSNNGLYYKVVRINDEDDDNDYPIIADCVGNDEEGSLEGDGYEYEEESFTLDGIFIICSRDKEDDLIPVPVEWPPAKAVSTLFEVGKYYRDREGYYYQVIAVDCPVKGFPVKAATVGGVDGTPIVHSWTTNYTAEGIYDLNEPGGTEDLLPTPVEWPNQQEAPTNPQSSPPEKTPNQNPPVVQPMPNSTYLLVEKAWVENNNDLDEFEHIEILVKRVLTFPENRFVVECVSAINPTVTLWKSWDALLATKVPMLLTQP